MNALRHTILRRVGTACIAALVLYGGGTRVYGQETVIKAIDAATMKIAEDLSTKQFPEEMRIAVLGCTGDTPDERVTKSLQSAIIRAAGKGFTVFNRNDDVFGTLWSEQLTWSDIREKFMDPKTRQEFGKVAGVDAYLFGELVDLNTNMRGTHTRVIVEAKLCDVETGEYHYSSGNVEGEAFIGWIVLVTRFWRYPVVLLAGLMGLLILIVIVWRLRRMFRPL